MFGFKKNKKDADKESQISESGNAEKKALQAASAEETSDAAPTKKKRSVLKKVLILTIAATILAGAGFLVFYFFFYHPDTALVYPEKKMAHVSLPDEMLRFCFANMPDVYDSLAEYDKDIQAFDQEIQRIVAVGEKYPDQARITDKEKKVWEKSRAVLEKSFTKIQKTIREYYVLCQVNVQDGTRVVEEQKEELAKMAASFLEPANAQLMKLDTGEKEAVPEGFFARQIYKIKKKFL